MEKIFEKDEYNGRALEILKFVEGRLLTGKRGVYIKYGRAITDGVINGGYLTEEVRIERQTKGIKPTLMSRLTAKLLCYSEDIFKDKQYRCSTLELTPKGKGLLNYN